MRLIDSTNKQVRDQFIRERSHLRKAGAFTLPTAPNHWLVRVRAGGDLRGTGQEPRDVPRPTHPRSHVQVRT